MWNIATREFRSLFLSPLAWSILGVVQCIIGVIFISSVQWFLRPDFQRNLAEMTDAPGLTDVVVGQVYIWVGIIMLLMTPLLTMRLFSDERRNKTLPLLLSAPVSMTSIVVGKYLGLMGFLMTMLALLTLMPLSLLLGASLDYGQFVAILMGVTLLIASFTAIGLYISTLTSYPTVAAIGTFGALLLLWIIDWAGESEAQMGLLSYLSITNHYQSLLKGLFSTEDIIYYLLVIILFLTLSIHRLDTERFQ